MNEGRLKSSPKSVARVTTRRTFLTLFSLFSLLAGTGCDNRSPSKSQHDVPDEKLLANPTKDIGKTATLTLYESLPDPSDQSALYHQEMSTKKTIRVDLGRPLIPFDFYEAPLKVSPEDTEELRTLFTASDSFHTDMIKCAFHPDYYLVWQDEGTSYEILLCLTCKQVRFSIAEQRPVYALVRKHKHDQLIDLMKKYVSQRPPKRIRK